MDKAYYVLSKTYNELININGLNPDKYEREDAFMTIWLGYKSGKDIVNLFKKTFNLVYDIVPSDDIILSRLALCGGFECMKGEIKNV